MGKWRKISKAYQRFKEIQLQQSEKMVDFKQAKYALNERLSALNHLLNNKNVWRSRNEYQLRKVASYTSTFPLACRILRNY